MPDNVAELQSTGAWQFFQDMLRDMTTVVTEDAESEREFVEPHNAQLRDCVQRLPPDAPAEIAHPSGSSASCWPAMSVLRGSVSHSMRFGENR
jgi:hypothetical protein